MGNAKLRGKVNFARGKISLGARAPENVYIVYQPRRRTNIMQVCLASVERRRCNNEGKTQNPLKFDKLYKNLLKPQTGKLFSAFSGLKFAILWGHVEEILLFGKCFPVVHT